MRLRWWRHDDERPGLDEAKQARQKAERDLEAAKAETPKFLELARALAEIRTDNHLAQALTRSFRGNK